MNLKIKGISISVSFSSIALFTLILISNFATNYLLCFIAILLHEFSHIVAMIVFKCRIIAVDITAFDVKIIENQRALLPVWQDIIISLAGPLGNILAFVLFIWINKTFAYINLFLGLFNLLPCISLDGGQSLYLILSKKLSNQVAKKIIEVLTVITMFPTFVMGIIVLFKSTYNFSLLFLSLYLLLLLLTKKI